MKKRGKKGEKESRKQWGEELWQNLIFRGEKVSSISTVSTWEKNIILEREGRIWFLGKYIYYIPLPGTSWGPGTWWGRGTSGGPGSP